MNFIFIDGEVRPRDFIFIHMVIHEISFLFIWFWRGVRNFIFLLMSFYEILLFFYGCPRDFISAFIGVHEISFLLIREFSRFHFYFNEQPGDFLFLLGWGLRDLISILWASTRLHFYSYESPRDYIFISETSTSLHFSFTGVHEISFLFLWGSTRFLCFYGSPWNFIFIYMGDFFFLL